MTYNGASGKTQEAMVKTLNFQGMSLEEINQANQELGVLLDSLNPEIKLYIANSIWIRQGLPFYQSFVQINQEFYRSQVKEIQSIEIINNWVKDKTQGKIEKIVELDSPGIEMALLNAIYFKGDWQQQFSEDSTQEMSFYLPNGTEKQHPIMSQSSKHLYYENKDFQAVSLPYGESSVSMYIFLPREKVGLEKFYRTLNEENWKKWMQTFDSCKINLGLQKFKTEYEITLNETLKSLGMEITFDSKKADFSGISSERLCISEVKHKTFVEVNETGTEAAGATSVLMYRSKPRKIVVDMLVNRPFFFAIIENDSDTILFMGEITNPET